MKKIVIILLVLGVLGGGGYLLYNYIYQDYPYFKTIKGLKINSFKADKISVSCVAVCYNPNKAGLRLAGTDIDVFANGKHVSKVKQTMGTEIGADKEFTFPMNVSFSPKKVFKAKDLIGPAFLGLLKKQVNMRYEGHVLVGLAGQDIEIPVDYEEAVSFKK